LLKNVELRCIISKIGGENMRHIFIVNPAAGAKDSTEYIRNLIERIGEEQR
jgi:hypothetical protein